MHHSGAGSLRKIGALKARNYFREGVGVEREGAYELRFALRTFPRAPDAPRSAGISEKFSSFQTA
jgi:hypothetical protein